MGIIILQFVIWGVNIVGYTFKNRVLRLGLLVDVKQNFLPYIQRYTSPNDKLEYSYPLILQEALVFGKSKPSRKYCLEIGKQIAALKF